MRAFKAEIVSGKNRETFLVPQPSVTGDLLFAQRRILIQQRLTFRLIELEMLPRFFYVSCFEVVHGKLLLFRKPHIAIG